MIGMRAVDLPEIRAQLLELSTNPMGREIWAGVWRTIADSPLSKIRGASPKSLEQSYQGFLREADLYWISATMSELAEVAAKTMPAFELQPEDLPSPYGLMFFEKPVVAVSIQGESQQFQYEITGLTWGKAIGSDGTTGVGVYALLEEAPKCVPSNALVVMFGEALPDAANNITSYYRVMRTCWLLMKQPLAAVSDATVDRAAKKRLRRSGLEPSTVRVVELRRPSSSGGSSDGGSNYHHQWIVRGHWRNHWHPKREVHRPVWIAPHIKGPEGAPLIGGEKVYALKR